MNSLLRNLATFLALTFCPDTLMAQAKIDRNAAPEKTINLYAWADDFDPSVFDDFTKETGIGVAYDAYASNEALDARLAAGKSGYDVVVLSGPILQKEIAAGLLQKLDKSKLPAATGLWPEITASLSAFDPGNLYAVNYTWFTFGLTYNEETIKARHEEATLSSWDAIFRPEILKKFADCGVEVQDSPNDLFAIALHYLRLDPRSKSLTDLKRASELLYNLRRNVKKFRTPGDLADLAGGDACLTVGWSSDAAQARQQAHDSESGIAIGYVIPKGGALVLLDNLAIPKDAPHADEAHLLINYLLRPDIAARNTKATHFANSVPASKPFVSQDILTDTSIYPDPSAMKSFFNAGSYNTPEQTFIAREWTHVKTGK